MAQLDRAPDYGFGGCRFDSCWVHHFTIAGALVGQLDRPLPSEGRLVPVQIRSSVPFIRRKPTRLLAIDCPELEFPCSPYPAECGCTPLMRASRGGFFTDRVTAWLMAWGYRLIEVPTLVPTSLFAACTEGTENRMFNLDDTVSLHP